MSTEQFKIVIQDYSINEVTFTWKTPSNIALVKYWGKTDPQIPKNTSISFTLQNCFTKTSIAFSKKEANNEVDFELFFEGKKKEDFKPKINHFFERILEYCPYLHQYSLVIHSENSFPHSSGIASSASGMAAIASCLMSLEKTLKPELTNAFCVKKASFLARLGSGSASRSLEGPLVVWGKHSAIPESSDLYGVEFPFDVAPIFKNYQDTILLVDKGQKQVSSTVGHDLMHNHPYASARFTQANHNIAKISEILQSGDIAAFINLVESEALTLHGMMMTSNPYFILMKPNTLQILNAIWAFRQATNSNVCFTLDAGANVHVLYPENEKEEVLQFIENELLDFCDKKQYICDNTGFGAKSS